MHDHHLDNFWILIKSSSSSRGASCSGNVLHCHRKVFCNAVTLLFTLNSIQYHPQNAKFPTHPRAPLLFINLHMQGFLHARYHIAGQTMPCTSGDRGLSVCRYGVHRLSVCRDAPGMDIPSFERYTISNTMLLCNCVDWLHNVSAWGVPP